MKTATKKPKAIEHTNTRRPQHAITDFVGVSKDTDAEWIKVAQAIRDIVTSDVTPPRLYNDVMGFLNDHSSDLWDDLMKSPEIILRILIIAATKDNQENDGQAKGGDHKDKKFALTS